jgi:His-Xaa-Ser system radical SAM maturase HxsC
MVATLTARASAVVGVRGRLLGRVVRHPVTLPERGDYFRVVVQNEPLEDDLQGYAAVLYERTSSCSPCAVYLAEFSSLDALQNDCVAVVDATGFTRVLYRPDSDHNALFATERCNSNCIMCSQPPRDVDDSGAASELLRIIDLIPAPPRQLGISGGEPTLLGDGLVAVLTRLKTRFPDTPITMLSNARLYADEAFTRQLAAVGHTGFLTSIPLYADNATDHDYIVQAEGAFEQTLQGLYNAARCGLSVELRVVLHKQTIPRLQALAEFIYRSIPFVQHVALMGLENMGYVKKNWADLWIDPVDYADTLLATVRHLYYRRIAASVYNLPLCVLPRELWGEAQQSISDFKNIYLDACAECAVKTHCAGLFKSSGNRHSRGIRAIPSL